MKMRYPNMLINILFTYYEILSCMQTSNLQEYLNKYAVNNKKDIGTNGLFNDEPQNYKNLNQTLNDINHKNNLTQSNYHNYTIQAGFHRPSNSNCPEITNTTGYGKKNIFHQTEKKSIYTMCNKNECTKMLKNPNCTVFYDSRRNSEIESLPLDLTINKKRHKNRKKINVVQAEKKPISKSCYNHRGAGYCRKKNYKEECILDKKQTESIYTCDKSKINDHFKHESTKKAMFFDKKFTPLAFESKNNSHEKNNICRDEFVFHRELLGNNSPKRINLDVKLEFKPERRPITHNYGCKTIKVEYQHTTSINNTGKIPNSNMLGLYKPKSIVELDAEKQTNIFSFNISNNLLEQTSYNANITQHNTLLNPIKIEKAYDNTKKKTLHYKIARIHRMLAHKNSLSAQNTRCLDVIHANPHSQTHNIIYPYVSNVLSTQYKTDIYKNNFDKTNDTNNMHGLENFFTFALQRILALHKNKQISIYHIKRYKKVDIKSGKQNNGIAKGCKKLVTCKKSIHRRDYNDNKDILDNTDGLNVEHDEELLKEIISRNCNILKDIYRIRNAALCAFTKILNSKNYLGSILNIKNEYWIYSDDYINYMLIVDSINMKNKSCEDVFSNLNDFETFIITEDMKKIKHMFINVIYEGFVSHQLTFNILYDLFVLNTPKDFTVCDEIMVKAKSLLINTNIKNHKNIELITPQLTLLNKYLLFCNNPLNTIDNKEEMFMYVCFLQLYIIYLSLDWDVFTDEIRSNYNTFKLNKKKNSISINNDYFSLKVDCYLDFIYHNQICLNDITAYLLWPFLPKYCFEKYVCLIYFENIHILARFMVNYKRSTLNHLKFYKTPINLIAKLFFASEIYIFDVFGETGHDIYKTNLYGIQKSRTNQYNENIVYSHKQDDLFGLYAYKYHIHLSTFINHFQYYLYIRTFWLVCNCYYYHMKSDVMNRQKSPYYSFLHSNEHTEMNISDFYFDLASKFTSEVLIKSCMSILTEKLTYIFGNNVESIL